MKFVYIILIIIIIFWIFFQFISPLKFTSFLKGIFRRQKGNIDDLKKLLTECASYLNSKNCNYLICYGTLLGIIREGDLISWDKDVDIMILTKDEKYFIDCMKQKFGDRFVEGLGLHRLFDHNNQYIDFYVFTDKKGTFLPKNRYLQYFCKVHPQMVTDIFPLKRIEWNNCLLNIPNNSVDVLEKCYGKDWMTPQKW